MNNPAQTIKNQWNTIADGTYMANITHGSRYCSVLYRSNGGIQGAAIIFGYPNKNVSYMRLNGGVWENEKSLITNDEFSIKRISYADCKNFKEALYGLNNKVTFFTFAKNEENPILDSPFSFPNGYGLSFHSGLISANNVFQLIAFNGASGKIEAKQLDLRN